MRRVQPLTRDRGSSFRREELIEESSAVLLERFYAGISNVYSGGINNLVNTRQIIDSLNALVKSSGPQRRGEPSLNSSFVSDERFLRGLHLGLFSPSTVIRAASARALRHVVKSNHELYILFRLNTNIPIARCLDIAAQTNVDYLQVVRLVSSLYRLASQQCPSHDVAEFFGVIISSCCSAILYEGVLARWQDSSQKSQKQQTVIPRKLTAEIIAEACLASSLPQSSLPSPQMLHSLMTVALSESFYWSLNEAIVGVFAHLLNYPHTRKAVYTSGVLELLIARFADDTVSPEDEAANKRQQPGQNQNNGPDKAPSFNWGAAQFTLTKLFHSCPGAWGLLGGGNYCHELLNGLAPPMGFEPGADNGSYFITARVSSRRIKRQKELLGLLAAIFNIEKAEWTTNISAAILSTDPRKFDDSWGVHEGFVAAEAEDLLYYLVSQRYAYVTPPPDPTSTLVALILSAFLEAHLVSALVTFSMSCFQYSLRGTKPAQKDGVVQQDPHLKEVECLGVRAAVILAHVLFQAKKLLWNGNRPWDEIESCVAAFQNNAITAERQDVVQTIFDIINQTDAFLSAAENKPASLHLELLMRFCPKPTPLPTSTMGPTFSIVESRPRSQSSSFAKQLLDSTCLLSMVPSVESINWPSIKLFFSLSPAEIRRSVSDSDMATAYKNLSAFFKSTGVFCHTDISTLLRNGGRSNVGKSRIRLADISHCAISLLEFLMAGAESLQETTSTTASITASLGVTTKIDYFKIAGDLISDICKTLLAIATNSTCQVGENSATALTMGMLSRVGAQFWFPMLGMCTSSPSRQALLEEHRSNGFEVLRSLIVNSRSCEVVRLALSFLNYATSEQSRQLLVLALKSDEPEIRLYAVKLITGLWLRVDDPFSFSKWAVPLIAPLISDSQWQVADSCVMALLDVLPRSPIAGSVIRSMKPPYDLSQTPHRLLYGCCLAAPGAWQFADAKESVAVELEHWAEHSLHGEYSKFCDAMFVESFSGCFSRQPGTDEHYSNVRSHRRLKLPGRHFPPSIFSMMARTQLGIHFLTLRTSEFVRKCAETLVYYAYADPNGDNAPKYNSEVVKSIRGSICILANIGSSPLGADWLSNSQSFGGSLNIVSILHSLARSSPVFSIRGTAIIGLSAVAGAVDPDLLVECQWIDRRRRSTLTRAASTTLSVADGEAPPMTGMLRRSTLSIPDIHVVESHSLAVTDQPVAGSFLGVQIPMKRRASTNDLPPAAVYELSSSSSSSSINSEQPASDNQPLALSARQSLPVTGSPLGSRPSLPVTVSRGNSMNEENKKRDAPRRQLSSISTLGNRISGIFRKPSNRSKVASTSAVFDQTDDSAFFPAIEKKRTSTESSQGGGSGTVGPSAATNGNREKSMSIEFESNNSHNRPVSGSFSDSAFKAGSSGSPRSYILGGSPQIGQIDENTVIDMAAVRQAQRSASVRSQQQQLQHQNSETAALPKSFFAAVSDPIDEGISTSTFYLPMEDLSAFGQIKAGVFLPPNVSELLEDDMTNVLGFRPNLPSGSPMPPRKMSTVSSLTTKHSGNKDGSDSHNAMFGQGQAIDMIREHNASQCLVCCTTGHIVNKRVAVSEDWQQVLWLVVSLNVLPNRGIKMLQSFLANNRNLISDGCLYSEVVSLMAKIALPRLYRMHVHVLFDASSCPELVTLARELNISTVV